MGRYRLARSLLSISSHHFVKGQRWSCSTNAAPFHSNAAIMSPWLMEGLMIF